MKPIALKVRLRTEAGKNISRKMRRQEEVPAVLYGHHKEVVNLTVPEHDFWQILHHATSEHMILELDIDGVGTDERLVLVRHVQHHPVSGDVVHIDFQRISLQERIKVGVPVILAGIPVGVKDFGGILDHTTREVMIQTTAAQIPESLEVDVSALEIGQSANVAVLMELYPGLEFVDDGQIVIAHVSPPKKVELPAAGEPVGEAVAPAGEEDEGEQAGERAGAEGD